MLKILFKKTHYFWIVSRFLIIALFAISTYNQIEITSIGSIIVLCLFTVYILFMALTAVMEILKRKVFAIIKVGIGALTIFFSFFLAYITFSLYGIQPFALFIVLIWLILYGLWEIVTAKDINKKIKTSI